jgi:hypothetical protein
MHPTFSYVIASEIVRQRQLDGERRARLLREWVPATATGGARRRLAIAVAGLAHRLDNRVVLVDAARPSHGG